MGRAALEGLNVVEFTWVMAGPFTGKLLADHGATVVHVESPSRPDIARSVPPFKGRASSVDRSVHFAEFNSNKYSLALDLSHPNANELISRLIRWADVVIESLRPGTLEKLGLGFDLLTQMNPRLVLASTTGYGQNGPDARLAAYGMVLAGISGFHALTGWPDRDPAQAYYAYVDIVAPPFNAAAILAAVHYARRTGVALHLDISQLECAVQFAAPLAMDYLGNGRDVSRSGNQHPVVAPHAVYRCQGDDEWCAIAAFNNEEWLALCETIGRPELARDDRFQNVSQRKAHEADLDKIVEEWTLGRNAEEVMLALQEVGVRAGKVHDPRGLFEDRQIENYRYFELLHHSELGPYYAQAPPFQMSDTPHQMSRPAPCLGQDNYYVCSSLLGFNDQEIACLMAEGVFN